MKRFEFLTSVLMVVFAALSIWLSIVNKNIRQEIAVLKAGGFCVTGLQETSPATRALSNVLEINLTLHPVSISKELSPWYGLMSKALVVYLKEYSCNSCNEGVLLRIFKNWGSVENLHIAAHETNRDYFNNLAAKNESIDLQRINWLSTNLYEGKISNHDAELLFLDHQNRITGIIPLEYLKLAGLLDGLVERFLNVE